MFLKLSAITLVSLMVVVTNTGYTQGQQLLPLFRQIRAEYRNGWDGSWFPHAPEEQDSNARVDFEEHHSLHDPNHGIKMGVKDKSCDDGKHKVDIDWDLNPINYTCFEDKANYLPSSTVHPLHTTEFIPHAYSALHKCMNESIEYDRDIPTFGTHRPLWARYGEYVFLPKQRWVHNLEHGSIIMLYHPCANKNEISLLKKLVKLCLYRHIITPYNLLSRERPLALVSWGHLLEMSKVSPSVVIRFIKEHALQAPEKISRDGQYSLMLLQHAEIVSDIEDSNLCPFIN